MRQKPKPFGKNEPVEPWIQEMLRNTLPSKTSSTTKGNPNCPVYKLLQEIRQRGIGLQNERFEKLQALNREQTAMQEKTTRNLSPKVASLIKEKRILMRNSQPQR